MSRPTRPRNRQGFFSQHRLRFWLCLVTLVLALAAVARLQVEWLWFQQFSLETVVLRRWLLQAAGFLAAACLALAGALWRHNWLRLGRRDLSVDREDPHRLAMAGLRYTFVLVLCGCVVVFDLLVLARLAWLAWLTPFVWGSGGNNPWMQPV